MKSDEGPPLGGLFVLGRPPIDAPRVARLLPHGRRAGMTRSCSLRELTNCHRCFVEACPLQESHSMKWALAILRCKVRDTDLSQTNRAAKFFSQFVFDLPEARSARFSRAVDVIGFRGLISGQTTKLVSRLFKTK